MKRALVVLLLIIGFAGASFGEGKFRADANVVLINATVLDHHDRPIRGLTRDQFRVFEDQGEQRIASFSEEEVPLSLAVVFDVSGSMDRNMAGMRAAISAVLGSANADDEFCLITFADRPSVLVDWSPDPEEIHNRLLLATSHGQTALLDALAVGLKQLKHARNPRKAMLIVSDGGDNHSRATERQLLGSMAEAGVQVYALDSAEPLILRTRSPEEFAGPDLLERFCDRAGGRYFQVDGKHEMEGAAIQIAREMRSQYLISYVPPGGAHDGRFHRVRVQVNHAPGTSKVSVFSR